MIVSFCDDLDAVLDDHDGVVFFNQTVKQVNEFSSVGRVEPYGGFLQNVVGFFDCPVPCLPLSMPVASSAASLALGFSPDNAGEGCPSLVSKPGFDHEGESRLKK